MRRIVFLTMIVFCVWVPTALTAETAKPDIANGVASDNNSTVTPSDKDMKSVPTQNEKDIKKIEAKTTKARDAIKEKEGYVDDIREETEKVIQEKATIEQQAKLKEQAATVAKQELEVAKKEAAATKSPEAAKRVRELAVEAKQLEKESDIYQEKLKIAETKSKLAEDRLAASQETVETLKKELADLKYQKASKRGLLDNTLQSLFIILVGIIMLVVVKFGIIILERILTKKDQLKQRELTIRIKTVGKIFFWLSNIVIIATVVYMILEAFGISVAPLIAGASIIGLAFGFGGQYLIRDVINGFFILVEDQYRIDDVIKIGDHGGLVEDINLRITTLRDLEGRVIIIPNGEIKTVINFTKEYAQALFDIRVAYKENIDKVMDVIKETGKEMRADPYFSRLIMDNLEMLGVDDFTESAVIIKFRIKTLPIKQWEVSREFRRRLKNRFDKLGIEIPFPHRTLYWGDNQEKKAAKKA